MKKNANVKKEIYKAWVVSIVSYFVASSLYLIAIIAMIEKLGLYWGFIIITPLVGFILAAPILIREENIIQHFEKLLKKEKDL